MVTMNPEMPKLLIKAHAEAIKRFYEDQELAVTAYMAYDPQSRTDVERFYDIYAEGNLFERVPYVLAGAVQAVIDQQSDPQLTALMRGSDYRHLIDNSHVARLVEEGFFEELFGREIRAEEDRKSRLAFR